MNDKERYTPGFRAVGFVAIFAAAFTALIYAFSWNQVEYTTQEVSLATELTELNDALIAIESRLHQETLVGLECKTYLSLLRYEINKDAVRNGHRYLSLYSNLAHTNALFITILAMIIAGLVFSIFQMATAYVSPGGEHEKIEIEAANIKLKTGYVSLAMSVLAITALSFYLPNAHEVKELDGKSESVDFTLTEALEECENASAFVE